MRDLCLRLAAPERGRLTVHVTGTKGKGSVSALVAAGLRAAGLSVGTYGSPHVERVTERIRIGAAEIGDDELAAALEVALEAHDAARAEGTPGAEASWFDLMSLAGFVAFRAAAVDVQVVEVGLGGRLDSTNVVVPDVCVVTNIDLEHAQILGGTRAAIAGEKAGILKPGAALVTGLAHEDEAGRVVIGRAEELELPVRALPPTVGEAIAAHNLRLARAVLAALEERGVPIDPGALSEGVAAAAALPGRHEWRVARGVPVLLDGAHVPSSLERVVAEALRERPGPAAVVVAVHGEKEPHALLGPLAVLAGPIFAAGLETGVHRTPEEIVDAGRDLGLDVRAENDASGALGAALDWAVAAGGWVLVTGSLYVVGAVRSETSSG